MLNQNEYSLLVNFNSIDEIINFLLNNSDYNESLSKYFTRYNPILSFIKSINDTNEIRWKNITRNLENYINRDIEKIQLSIDLKNIILLINLFPTLQNDQKVNVESLISNLDFGGTISDNIWLELSNDFSFSSLLAKTIISYPKIHDFIVKFRNKSALNSLEAVTLEIITSITFDNEKLSSSDIILNSLSFDTNIYLLRYIIRYEQLLEDQDIYNKLKVSLRPWKKSRNFIGSDLYSYDQFNRKLNSVLLQKILKICSKYNIAPGNEISSLTDNPSKKSLSLIEDMLFHAKLNYLKREYLRGNQIAKLMLVLFQIILERKNLAWIFFSKSQGFDNEIIKNKLYFV